MKAIYLKTSFGISGTSFELLNIRLLNFYVEINHSKKEIKVNGKVYKLKVIEGYFLYDIDPENKTIKCGDIAAFQEFLIKGTDPDDNHHRRVYNILRSISNS
ncbi:hypothetical protein [uncultured Chryseobacterium sp.]|uniref:hypothetical protein n=1 Tax=uncultured Chryseobacterium sp. TaxID=259322 RepID=UPI0025D1386E|nr:hypothetical protein [uncultured Chryseobacterium sp.]